MFREAIKYLDPAPKNPIKQQDMVVIPSFSKYMYWSWSSSCKLPSIELAMAQFSDKNPANVIWNYTRAIRNIDLVLQLVGQGLQVALDDYHDLTTEGTPINVFLNEQQAAQFESEDAASLTFDDWRNNVEQVNGYHLYKNVSVALIQALSNLPI